MSDEDFFIGWAKDMPVADRRVFLASGAGLTLATGALAAGLAAFQRPPGPGTWNQGNVQEFTGIVSANPYPMLHLAGSKGEPVTALLSSLGKCGVRERLGIVDGRQVTITGSAIRRRHHLMIAVADGPDWLRPADIAAESLPAMPAAETLGMIELRGEILDSKCWFGAMRPSEGKVHKACAALCIRGGLPPAFFASSRTDRGLLMLLTDRDGMHGEDLLPYVADPVRIRGALKQQGDLLYLDAPVSAIKRL